MRRLFVACVAAFAAFNSYGIGATQEWVRRHVVDALSGVVRSSSATNIEVAANIPAAAFTGEGADTNATYSATIRAGTGTHTALKVVASSVPAIPAGTFYALDDSGNYVNCSNSLITTIYAAPYTVPQVTTNALGGVSTNYVRMGNFWAMDSTNGVWRMGIDGDTILYNSGNRSAYFAIRSTTLPERAAAVLIPPQTAQFSIRELLSLIVPTAHARTSGETVYTINSETTIAISTITFTSTNRFGKKTTITFTPDGLFGVYTGPNGPFATKAEAEAAARDISNWNFGDWDAIWNAERIGRMTRDEFENSDVWKQLVSMIGTDRTEAEVPTPGMPAHPCPAPDDFYVFDTSVWNNPNISDADALATVWKINSKYSDGQGGYDREKLDQWRGQNDCKCEVVGCGNCGVSQHRPGRVKITDGEETFTDDVDGGDGCKCCIRCVKYGGNVYKTIDEYNDHRASGEGAGFCGCACGKFTHENENVWDRNYHNFPAHTLAWPNKDFSCMCYCAKTKALNGDFVQHAKYAGDSPWCENICARCGMVEDKERYINHSYPAFDTRHVTLRAAKWDDHAPRAEAGPGVSALNDPTYYSRCGCACGQYDGVLPAAFGKFHQYHNNAGTCLCTCGQNHSKDSLGEGNGTHTPSPCPKICSVCGLVEDETAGTITIDGETYPKLIMRQPTQWGDHEANDAECGCKCGYISATDTADTDAATKLFHVARDEDFACLCKCNRFHEGEWETATCGANSWRQCTLFEDHIYDGDTEQHEYANGHPDDSVHFCKCAKKRTEAHTKVAGTVTHEPGWIITPYSCSVSGCGWSKTERTACTHTWGNWLKISDFPGGSLFRKTCSVCGATDDMLVNYEDAQNCNTNLNIHIPAEDVCGCKCGYYGTRVADEKDFHKWDATDTEGGVANCHCQCGAKHEWRDGCACAAVCAYCKEVKKDGTRAGEADHTITTANRCGCKCGYYGVSAAHAENAGHFAESYLLHKRATTAANGTASSPAACQCYGADGKGGLWHWHDPRTSATCPNVCKWILNGETFGHLAAPDQSGIPTKAFQRATPAHHVPNAYGCGCKCGLCVATGNGANIGEAYTSNDDKDLHRPPQTGNRCDCACEKYKAVAKGSGTINGHAFPITHSAATPMCTCTCGKTHRAISGHVNACGYCDLCGNIWRNGTKMDASIRSNHLWTNGGCYCDGACNISGKKMLHEDGHVYAANSCTCNCGEETLDHIAQSSTVTISHSTCSRCGAGFEYRRISLSCARCGTSLGDDKYVYVGKHADWCGTPSRPRPGCSKCGCHCTGTCSGHYCNACCTSKPPKRPKRPTPEDPEDVPDPCNHNGTGRREVINTDTWTCDICGHTLSSTTWNYYCLVCNAFVTSRYTTSGSHGEHPGGTGGESDDPGGEPTTCDFCGAVGNAHSPDCPNFVPTGGGNSGGSGDIDDI